MTSLVQRSVAVFISAGADGAEEPCEGGEHEGSGGDPAACDDHDRGEEDPEPGPVVGVPHPVFRSQRRVHVVQVPQRPRREHEGDVRDDEQHEVDHHREVDRPRPLHRVRPIERRRVRRPQLRHPRTRKK